MKDGPSPVNEEPPLKLLPILLRQSRSDVVLRITAFVYVAVALHIVTTFAGARRGPVYSLLLIALTGLVIVAILKGLRELPSKERRFWRRLGIAYCFLVMTPVVAILFQGLGTTGGELAFNLAFGGYYLYFILALGVRPHRLSKRPMTGLERAFAWPLLPAIVIGLLSYLVVLPLFIDPQDFHARRPYLQYHFILQLLIVIRMLWTLARVRARRWFWTFGLVVLSQAGLGAVAMLELSNREAQRVGLIIVSDLLLATGFLLMVAAARLRHVDLPHENELYQAVPWTEVSLSSKTAVVAIGFALLHFVHTAWGPGNLLAEQRLVFVSIWIVLLCVLALTQRELLGRRLRRTPNNNILQDAEELEEKDLRLLVERAHAELPDVIRGGRMAHIFLTCPDLLCIQRLHDGVILETNPAWTRFLGFERRDLVGRTDPQVGHWPDNGERVGLRKKLVAGETVRDHRTTWQDSGGRQIPVVFSSATFSLRDVPCCIDIIRPIETRAPQRTELFDHVAAAVVICDLQGRITYWNPGAEKAWGWSSNEALGGFADDLLGIDLGSSRTVRRLDVRTKSGSIQDTESWWTSLYNQDGRPRSRLFIAVPWGAPTDP